jgi:hypothetical protein
MVHELRNTPPCMIHHNPNLGRVTILLFIIHFVNDHEDYNKMIFKIQEPQMGSLKIFPSYEFC